MLKSDNRAFAMVTSIINKWNPADFYPVLYDEYVSEVRGILLILKSEISVESAANQLYTLFVNYLGDDFCKDKSECLELAHILLKLKIHNDDGY